MSARSIVRISSLLSFIALATTACSIGKPVPQATTYIVEPSAPEQLWLAHGKEVVRMGNVRLAAAFAGSSLIYRTDDVTFVSDPYQAFIADPPAMFGTQMAAWLDRAGPFKAVTQPDSALSAKYRLEATVTELYGDFRPGRPATAVMTVQFALVDVDAIGPGLLFERTIARRVPLEGASPSALVRGYNRAVTEILSELAGDLAAKGLR
jgi:cholesterol transport system auxiliary component